MLYRKKSAAGVLSLRVNQAEKLQQLEAALLASREVARRCKQHRRRQFIFFCTTARGTIVHALLFQQQAIAAAAAAATAASCHSHMAHIILLLLLGLGAAREMVGSNSVPHFDRSRVAPHTLQGMHGSSTQVASAAQPAASRRACQNPCKCTKCCAPNVRRQA